MKVLSNEQVKRRIAKLDADPSPEANQKFVEYLRAIVYHSGGVVRACTDLTTDEIFEMFKLRNKFHLIGAGKFYLLPKLGENFPKYYLTSEQKSTLRSLNSIWPFNQGEANTRVSLNMLLHFALQTAGEVVRNSNPKGDPVRPATPTPAPYFSEPPNAALTDLSDSSATAHSRPATPSPAPFSEPPNTSLPDPSDPSASVFKTPVRDDNAANPNLFGYTDVSIYHLVMMDGVRYKIGGRLDYAISYDGPSMKPSLSGILLVVEAKIYGTLKLNDYVQLAAYLAMIREKRIEEEKRYSALYGCLTDGAQYIFYHLDKSGLLHESDCFRPPYGDDSAFSFLVSIMATAIRQSPTSSPLRFRLPNLAKTLKEVEEAVVADVDDFDTTLADVFWVDVDSDDSDIEMC